MLLIDERPEEVTAWTREVPEVEIAAAPADLGAHEQVRTAERILAKVKRQAEAGNDVVIIVDSLTRLGTAYGDAGAVKPFFGAGRELEEEGTGSVTVIATALWGSPGDQDVMDAVHTTENSTIRLDASLAAAGVVPSLDVTSCAVSGQESVLDEAEVDAVRRLRAELKDMEPVPAANRLAELIKGSANNEELHLEEPRTGSILIYGIRLASGFSGGRRRGARRALWRARSFPGRDRAGCSRKSGGLRQRRCRVRLP